MTNYGKNFGFRIPPRHGQRSGKHYVAASTVIGAPVKWTGGAETGLGLMPMQLATGSQAKPLPGLGGILVFEYAPAAFAGYDEFLTTYSDLSTCPAASAVQVIGAASDCKVWFKNTDDENFLHNRTYAGRIMVNGLGGATPTVEVGEYLTPGVGNDDDGYWAVTVTAANAWLVVTKVDNDRNELEARINF